MAILLIAFGVLLIYMGVGIIGQTVPSSDLAVSLCMIFGGMYLIAWRESNE